MDKPLPKGVVLVVLASFVISVVALTALRRSIEPSLEALPQRPTTLALGTAWIIAGLEWLFAVVAGLVGWTGSLPQRRTILWLLGAALAEAGFLVGWVASMGQPFPSILGFAAGALAILLAIYLPYGLTLGRR